MVKRVVKPYYGFKKESYNTLCGISKDLLKGTSYANMPLVFSYDLSNNLGNSVVVSAEVGGKVLSLFVVSLESGYIYDLSVGGISFKLEGKRLESFRRNCNILLKHSMSFRDDYVTLFFKEEKLKSWMVTGFACRFEFSGGSVYENVEGAV